MALQLIHSPNAADLNRQSGIAAYEWVSFHPVRRAEQDIADYIGQVEEFASMCERTAETPEQIVKAIEEVERFRLGYIKHQTTVWAASSRCASPMITGPARFPVEKNRKRMDTYERRSREFWAWMDKARKAARRNIEKIAEPPREVDSREPITETIDGVEVIRNFALDKEFIRISRVKSADDLEGFGRPIKVSGKDAYFVGHNGQYVRFVRPDSDVVLLSHPLDVEGAP